LERYKYCEQLLGIDTLSKLLDENNLYLLDYLYGHSYIEIDDKIENINLLEVLKLKDYLIRPKKDFISRNSNEDFIPFFNELLEVSIYIFKFRFPQAYEKMNSSLLKSFKGLLYTRIKSICIRCLIYEYQDYRKKTCMIDPIQSNYNYFENNVLTSKEYMIKFLNKYPILYRCLCEVISYISVYIIEIIENLEKDKNEIVETLLDGDTFHELLEIETDISDFHNSNKSVALLRLDNGRTIVYKPHSLENEMIHYHLLSWLYEACGLSTHDMHFINREDYGWCTFINQVTCDNVKQLERYYKRFGIIILLSYILNTTDLHFENVIAGGEYPVIIDLETLVGSPLKEDYTSIEFQIKDEINKSVLHSALLPLIFLGVNINFSAISGKKNQRLTLKVPKIINSRSNEISIGYEKPLTKSGKNLASLNGKEIQPKEFLECVIEGFEQSYKYCLSNKDRLINKLSKLSNATGRYLVRDTQQYMMMLSISYHPEFLKDGAKRNLLFYRLFNENSSKGIKINRIMIDKEIDCLLKGDIPIFTFNMKSRNLMVDKNVIIQDYFMTTPLQELIHRVKLMCDDDLITQRDFIIMTLNTDYWNKSIHHINAFKSNVDKKMLITAVERIGNRICESAVFSNNLAEVGWCGIVQSNNNTWSVESLGNRLYDGLAGVAVFMNALFKVIPKSIYGDICGRIDQTLFKYTDKLVNQYIDDRNLGAFSGEYSIVYMYQLLYIFTNKRIYLEYARKHALCLEGKNVASPDIIDGKAGILNVIINFYIITNEKQFMNKAIQLGEELLQETMCCETGLGWRIENLEKPLAGFSHGNAGIVYSLLRLSGLTNKIDANSVIKSALEYEQHLYNEDLNNWIDLRGNHLGACPVAWCHGASGILLSLLQFIKNKPKAEGLNSIEDTVQKSIALLENNKGLENMCLCHGIAGNIMVIDKYAKVTGDEKLQLKYRTNIHTLAESIINDFIGLNIQNKQLSFMTGLPGIGYMMLSQLDKQLPCILALDIV